MDDPQTKREIWFLVLGTVLLQVPVAITALRSCTKPLGAREAFGRFTGRDGPGPAFAMRQEIPAGLKIFFWPAARALCPPGAMGASGALWVR
jgi:hypothetical protein